MKPDMIRILQNLGFTEYEAKAYIALLQKSPMSGYAIALNSGVPRSKIYEVIEGLVGRGEILASHGSPVLYSPLSPKELISLKRRRTEINFDAAEEALESFEFSTENRENIWNITGREEILHRIKEVIANSEQRILLEIWGEDVELIKDELKEAENRGVEIYIVSYGTMEYDFAHVYPHDHYEEITNEYGGRWVILSVDDKEIVAGIISIGTDSRAAWTLHPGLVMPITEVIKHDIYILEIMKKHRELLEADFGPDLIDLRNRFNIERTTISVASKLGLIKTK
jgi:HTH-type transcriptional regulator, sugar sensing transcriptional regulator